MYSTWRGAGGRRRWRGERMLRWDRGEEVDERESEEEGELDMN